jgi:TonB family protein
MEFFADISGKKKKETAPKITAKPVAHDYDIEKVIYDVEKYEAPAFPAVRQFLAEFFANVLGDKKKGLGLKITAKPVAVKEIWGWSGRNRKVSILSSIVIHSVLVLFLVLAFQPRLRPTHATSSVVLFSPSEISPYIPKQSSSRGGGGGGDRSPLPASKGRLPRQALSQLAPPTAIIRNENPRLPVEPTVIVAPDIKIPQPNISAYGDPLYGVIGPPSNGPGSGGGIGSGRGGGVGPGSGPGVGPGEGGGFGGGVFRAGSTGVSPPQLLYKVEPEYTEEARKARYQGTVIVEATVGADGNVYGVMVVRALGLGLDEQAIIAIKQWKFKPGLKDGKPVPVAVSIETTFRLL